jgi:hypothetical protein
MLAVTEGVQELNAGEGGCEASEYCGPPDKDIESVGFK